MADSLTTTMEAIQACACDALDTIERPACACGLTIGPPAEGPQGCCDCNDGSGGKVSVFLERVYPADPTTFEQTVRREDCKPGATAADISVVVVRCYPSMDNQGKMPSLDVTTPYAENLNADLTAVWNGLKCCGIGNFVVREAAIDADPEGGCSGFAIRVTTLVALPASGVDVS